MDAVLFDSIVSQLLSKKQDQTIEAWLTYVLRGRWIQGEIMLTCQSFARASISVLLIAAICIAFLLFHINGNPCKLDIWEHVVTNSIGKQTVLHLWFQRKASFYYMCYKWNVELVSPYFTSYTCYGTLHSLTFYQSFDKLIFFKNHTNYAWRISTRCGTVLCMCVGFMKLSRQPICNFPDRTSQRRNIYAKKQRYVTSYTWKF